MRETHCGNRAVIVMAWSLLGMQPVTAWAQSGSGADAPHTFEVASVRPSGPEPPATSWTDVSVRLSVMPGGRFVATRIPLERLIRFAYALQVHEAIDASGWASLLEQTFHVDARSGAGDVPRAPTGVVGPMNVMVQNLLTERFRLRVRWEDREEPVLVLVRARSDGRLGPGLRASSVDCADPESRKRSEAAPGDCM